MQVGCKPPAVFQLKGQQLLDGLSSRTLSRLTASRISARLRVASCSSAAALSWARLSRLWAAVWAPWSIAVTPGAGRTEQVFGLVVGRGEQLLALGTSLAKDLICLSVAVVGQLVSLFRGCDYRVGGPHVVLSLG